MNFYYVAFRSITWGQRGANILNKAGISTPLVRTPKNFNLEGCSYSLKINEAKLNRALELLNKSGLKYSRIFLVYADGSFREVCS